MKKEAHRAFLSALQVRSLWGHTTSSAWTLSYTICIRYFFLWSVSPTVSPHAVKTFKFGIMLARAVFLYWQPDGQNPSSQAPTCGLKGGLNTVPPRTRVKKTNNMDLLSFSHLSYVHIYIIYYLYKQMYNLYVTLSWFFLYLLSQMYQAACVFAAANPKWVWNQNWPTGSLINWIRIIRLLLKCSQNRT